MIDFNIYAVRTHTAFKTVDLLRSKKSYACYASKTAC